MFDDAHEVRLFSIAGVKGEREAEQRATAAFLAVLTAVRPLSRRLLCHFGASRAERATIQAWTEVPFELDSGETVRPDGVVQVKSAQQTFVALVETKVGDRRQDIDQIERYMKLARAKGFDCLITISGEVAPFDGAHPTAGADALAGGKVGLHHLSWTRILAETFKELAHHGVDDVEQAWLVSELIRYLEHPNSGVPQSSDMGEHWVDVRDRARDGLLLKPTAEVMDICRRWDQILHATSMRLGAELGIDVQEVVPRAHRRNPALRDKTTAASLCGHGCLEGRLRIPGAVSDLVVVADLRASRIVLSSEFPAPPNKGAKGRVGWLVRQLHHSPADLTVEAFARGAKTADIAMPLQVIRDQPESIRHSKDRPAARFRVSQRAEMGQGRRTVRKLGFIDSITESIDRFYGDVLQHLRAIPATPPQMDVAMSESDDALSVGAPTDGDAETGDDTFHDSPAGESAHGWPWVNEWLTAGAQD